MNMLCILVLKHIACLYLALVCSWLLSICDHCTGQEPVAINELQRLSGWLGLRITPHLRVRITRSASCSAGCPLLRPWLDIRFTTKHISALFSYPDPNGTLQHRIGTSLAARTIDLIHRRENGTLPQIGRLPHNSMGRVTC